MIIALALAVAAPAASATGAIEAERAFAAQAQKDGQWTAFRSTATGDALMFVPQPTNAQAFLKDRKDPPVSVFWWPGKSFVSCDGKVAVNTGPWVRGGGKSVGYFTTVWVRQPDGGWKWVYDAGDELTAPRAEGGDIKPTIASCSQPGPPAITPLSWVINKQPTQSGHGSSPDGTLGWKWTVDAAGARHFQALLWTGREWRTVIDDSVAAAK